ncbi:uncharacterized protein LOC134719249 [Mytilus trossulus]|uniref:uncharacterized protein LOC134719249 n=1 Tax=Mytilus trossulus TaxID=6551 RepID=UPI003004A8FB
MECSFFPKFVECDELIQPLPKHSADQIFIILSENGLKPSLALSHHYSICTSHLNYFLKNNSKCARRRLWQIPRLLSAHPDIDHTQDSGLQSLPHRTSLKLASRGLKEKDVLHLINQKGTSLPVNTPCCTLCLKNIRIYANDVELEEVNEVDEPVKCMINSAVQTEFEYTDYSEVIYERMEYESDKLRYLFVAPAVLITILLKRPV